MLFFNKIIILLLCFSQLSLTKQLSPKEEVQQLFNWSINQYLEKGFPYDTLKPISCEPPSQDKIDQSDVYSNNPSLLIDSITTYITMKDDFNFIKIATLIKESFSIQKGTRVQLFEFNIRVLGSFISSHLHAINLRDKKNIFTEYDDWFLKKALEVGNELIQGFKSPTGLPFSRIEFGNGVNHLIIDEPELMSENNPVALACPFLEFTLLSILTGDDKFRIVSEYSLDVVIKELRSAETGLLSFSYDPIKKNALELFSGVGANVDSVMEYMLKGAILFDNDYYLDLFDELFNAVTIYLDMKWFYKVASTTAETFALPWIDSLAAYLPGTLVLDGKIETAELKNLFYIKLWGNYRAIPERWNVDQTFTETDIALEWYPLRPEMIESCYFLYQATKDPFYLHIGEEILKDLKNRYTCECGLCGVQDIRTGELQDEMETFVLGETLKYLYLLFDYADQDRYNIDNIVFTTEAHPVYLNNKMLENYYENRFFNDTFFANNPRYTKFINKTINYNHQLSERTCPNILLPSKLNESPLMNRGDLFHFDAEYDDHLRPLDYLNLTYDRLELNPDFYNQYGINSTSSMVNIYNHSRSYYTEVSGTVGLQRQYKIYENKISKNYYKSYIGCQVGFNLLNSTQQELIKKDFGMENTSYQFALLTQLDYDFFNPEDTVFISKKFMQNISKPLNAYEMVNALTPFRNLTVTSNNCIGCNLDFILDFKDPKFLSKKNVKKIEKYYKSKIEPQMSVWLNELPYDQVDTKPNGWIPVKIGEFILINTFYKD
ncbi:hypothetical protein ACO0SA_002202 [Hanseniaspora valbyensis]